MCFYECAAGFNPDFFPEVSQRIRSKVPLEVPPGVFFSGSTVRQGTFGFFLEF